LVQEFPATEEVGRQRAKVVAERLLMKRKTCQTRIIRIDRKLAQLSKKYGLELDGNSFQEMPTW
jgi:hypothetical protein